jgi:hypothetical protein
MGDIATFSLVVGIPLIIGFALGYGIREWISRRWHRRHGHSPV